MQNLQFTKNTTNRFSVGLCYNIDVYLDLYSYFLENNQPRILEYFQEENVDPDVDSFDMLQKLIKEATKINDILKIQKNKFNKIDDWSLMEYLEDIRINLETIDNTSKYTRSSKNKNSWRSQSIQIEYFIDQNETLEDVQIENYGTLDFHNKWIDIALQNNLSEMDYTPDGGKLINLQKNVQTNKNFYLESIVDNLQGEKLYGLDIYQKLTFLNNDVLVLSHKDTVLQSINTLILLKKGDIPEFPNFGVDSELTVGTNINIFNYFLLIKQLEEVFSTDDSLVDFAVMNYSYLDGDLYLNYNIGTFYNLTYNKTNKLN